MRQLEYTNSDFRFEYYMVELLLVLNFNHYDYFPLRYSYIPICATSARWQRHLCHFMDIG